MGNHLKRRPAIIGPVVSNILVDFVPGTGTGGFDIEILYQGGIVPNGYSWEILSNTGPFQGPPFGTLTTEVAPNNPFPATSITGPDYAFSDVNFVVQTGALWNYFQIVLRDVNNAPVLTSQIIQRFY